jgi:hypothetical protein
VDKSASFCDSATPRRSTLAGMGTEVAVPLFGPLIVIGVLVLLYVAIRGHKSSVDESPTLGLGRSRIALGYLGAIVGLVAYSCVDTVEISRIKVARGDVTDMEAAHFFFGWFLNIFCLSTPFMILLMSALGLPLLSALRRIRFASLIGALLTSQIVAAFFTWLFLSPYTEWCRLHELLCFQSANKSNAILAGMLTLGFALGARLPWLYSAAMPANNRLE